LDGDGIQWILMRRRMGRQPGWRLVSFVRSTKDVLARRMREKMLWGGGEEIASIIADASRWSPQCKS
jgi:hypothetical protein